MNLRSGVHLLQCAFSKPPTNLNNNSCALAVVDSLLAAAASSFSSSSSIRSFASGHRPALHPSEAKIMDGKAIARQMEAEVAAEIAFMTSSKGNRRRPPHLTAVLVGEDPASDTYVANKIKACDRSGITSDTVRLPDSVSEDALMKKISQLNNDSAVDGILVQLPVPPHIDERRVCNVSFRWGNKDRLKERKID